MIAKPEFEAAIAAEGYVEIETKALPPRPANGEHGHHYAVKGLVLGGVFTVIQNNAPVAFRRGEVFFVPAGDLHCEEIGPEGAEICFGRKY
jgi:quercetin dioxygenase-like cupin family protein